MKKLLDEKTLSTTKAHEQLCQINFRTGDIRSPTKEEERVLEAVAFIASAILDSEVEAVHSKGYGYSMTYHNKRISVNLNVAELWLNPFKNPTLEAILHECAHDKFSGHGMEHSKEIARLAGKFSEWWIQNGAAKAKEKFSEFFDFSEKTR